MVLVSFNGIPAQKRAGDFSFSVSSVLSVVRKSGFPLDFEHTIFVVKKIRKGNRRQQAPPPEDNEVERAKNKTRSV